MTTTRLLRAFALSVTGVAFTLAVAQEKPLTAQQHYDHIQGIRHSLGEAIRGKAPARDETATAVDKLKGLLEYMDRQDVRELATGNIFLYARRHDVLLDLAGAYARLGETEKALDALEGAQALFVVPGVSQMIAAKSEYSSLRDEPRFKALAGKAAMVDRVWNTPNIATPYREHLTLEERVAGLSLFWAEARSHFVHFDNVPNLEWDKRYLEALSKVSAAGSTHEYYDILMRFAPLLGDGHTNIYPPDELGDRFYSRPPIRTRLIEGKVLVTAVRSARLAERVRVGDEVMEVDGLPVGKHAEERVAPYVSASTPQDKALRTYTYQFLLGDADKPIALKLRDAKGAERVETVSRTGYTDVQSPAQFAFRMTPEGVAVITLDHFESDAGVKAFEKALPDIMKSKALVIDIRENGGGSTSYGLNVLSYLTGEPIPVSKSFVRGESALDLARGSAIFKWSEVAGSGRPHAQKRKEIFAGPVAVLVGPQTFSAAEDFLVSFDSMKRGLIVGEATGDSTGQPMQIKLPGGGSGRICIKRDVYPDGRKFVGKGILPTIEVKQTVAGLRDGRDPVLERAIQELTRAK